MTVLAGLSPVRLALAVLGVAGIVTGAAYVLTSVGSPINLIWVGGYLLGPALITDLVLLPASALVGWLIVRLLPRPWRAPIAVACALSVFTLLIGWPFLGGFGRKADNPSLLNRDYLTGTLVLLAAVWSGALAAGVVRAIRVARATTS